MHALCLTFIPIQASSKWHILIVHISPRSMGVAKTRRTERGQGDYRLTPISLHTDILQDRALARLPSGWAALASLHLPGPLDSPRAHSSPIPVEHRGPIDLTTPITHIALGTTNGHLTGHINFLSTHLSGSRSNVRPSANLTRLEAFLTMNSEISSWTIHSW